MRPIVQLLYANFLLILVLTSAVAQNGGGHILFGDFKVDESKVTGPKPLSFDLLLYTSGGRVVARQSVVNNSHYRFMDLANGDYDIVVEVEGNEVARLHVLLNEIFKTDIRQDIALEWHEQSGKKIKPGILTVDLYKRTPKNQKEFEAAREAVDKKKYEAGIAQLQVVLADDPGDYQAWTELGTVYLIQMNLIEAEKSYQRAIDIKPDYLQALMNLGRLRLMTKNFNGAVDILSKAVVLKADSAEANYYLGEAYLQVKKGSKAVVSALYNAAGMKDKAAIEYEDYLKKKPDYPDKKRLEQYISANKKNM